MSAIVVAECRARIPEMIRRRNTLIALAFPAMILMVLACASLDEVPGSVPPTQVATATGEATPSAQQVPTEAEVVRVIDGVTIEVEKDGMRYLVRYLGVSIPATADLADALKFNQFIAQGKSVVMSSDVADMDSDGTHLRYVFIDGEMVNLKLLNGGWGEVAQFPASFEKFEEFLRAESMARTDGRGAWSVKVEPSRSEDSAPVPQPTSNPNMNFTGGTLPARPGSQTGPASVCDFSGSNTPIIKGNVEQRTGERVYHVPGGLFYSTTAVDLDQGDRWLCTEAEAYALGWKRSKR